MIAISMAGYRWIPRRVGWAAVAIACSVLGMRAQSQPVAQTLATAAGSGKPVAAPNAAMTGHWDYNDDLSVDAATGRPEQAPLSATQRRRGAGPTGSSGGSAGVRPGGAGSADDFERSVQALFLAERRALVRDLLEVPEQLRVKVTDAGVTFVDDLKRERSFPTDGKQRKYQFGAAQFEARASWDSTRLRKDIEGPNNFKMSEVYFLAEDGNHLIVVIRVGDPKNPDAQFGVNRIYDRVGAGTTGTHPN